MTTDNVKPGRGYIYVEMTIKDPKGFKQYTALSAPAVHAAGGRYIVLGVRPEFLEGSTEANRIVIVEFDSVAKAREFYHSAAYQAARQKRLTAAEFRIDSRRGTSVCLASCSGRRSGPVLNRGCQGGEDRVETERYHRHGLR